VLPRKLILLLSGLAIGAEGGDVLVPSLALITVLVGEGSIVFNMLRVRGSLMGPVNGTVFNLAPILVAHCLTGVSSGFQRIRARRPVSRARSGLSRTPASSAH
jgi:hypothetical protein